MSEKGLGEVALRIIAHGFLIFTAGFIGAHLSRLVPSSVAQSPWMYWGLAAGFALLSGAVLFVVIEDFGSRHGAHDGVSTVEELRALTDASRQEVLKQIEALRALTDESQDDVLKQIEELRSEVDELRKPWWRRRAR